MAPPRGNAAGTAQQDLGLPKGLKTYTPFPFGGMNLQASGPAIADQEFQWIENFFRLGDGNLRAAWDVGPSLYTAAGSIVYYSFYTIGETFYCAVFLNDGSAVQIDMVTRVETVIGTGFYLASTGNLPYARQWGTQYLLICNNNTRNDYWMWDGTLLYTAGTSAPEGVNILSGGLNYQSVPTITAYGGSGTGMTFSAQVSGGSVVQIQITNPGTGYEVGDIVQLAFSGGGSDNSAILTAHLSAGGVGGVTVTAGGSGYTSAPTVVFSGGGGAGATGTAVLDSGAVKSVTITNPGTGYTTAPTVTFSGGAGTGATGVSSLAPQGVASISVDNGGTGFVTVPTLNTVGGGGAGAVAIAVLSPTSIAAANVTAGGSGYTSAPTVALVGGGTPTTDAVITAHLVGDAVGYFTVDDPGAGYTAAVQLALTGGDGTGAGGTVLFAPTSIASVVVSATGQFYTTAPTVQVNAGANNSAYATVSLAPYGVSGSALETYLSRVWIVDPAQDPFSTLPPGGNFLVSAPGSVTDFATSDGGVAASNTDSFLQRRYVNVRQSSGYLYFLGDGSVSVVSNVATSGSPATTTYNYQNVDPQSGLAWRDALQDFGRSLVLPNATGVYGLYGGAATKLSAKLDQLFTDAIFPPTAGAILPTACIATIFNIKHYLLLMTVRDPDSTDVSPRFRNVMVTWNEKEWTISVQTVNFTQIATQKVGSSYVAWGNDGRTLWPLFQTPSLSLAKQLDTKDYGGDAPFIIKELWASWIMAQDRSTGAVGIDAQLSLTRSGIATQNSNFGMVPSGISNNPFFQPVHIDPLPKQFYPLFGVGAGDIPFVALSARLRSTSPDFVLVNWVLGYTFETGVY